MKLAQLAHKMAHKMPIGEPNNAAKTSRHDHLGTALIGFIHAPHNFASGVRSGFPQCSHGGPYNATW